MSSELAKAYEPSAVEAEAYRVWTEKKAFHAEPGDPGKPYSIVIPPPNVTAALHLGHALNNTLQDILTRWHRMMGDNTCWLPGTDHAGIATQTVVEKRVLAEEGKKRTDFARDEFVGKIQAWKDEYEARITEQLKRMGCSCDWDRQAFTMDEQRAKAVREAFFRLFKDGLIYRGKRLVNWDPATQTALADDEVEMEEIDGHFYYLRYPIVEEGGSGFRVQGSDTYVTVATTRPETMLGDTAVAINPKDPRAAQLRGKKVRLPIVNRIVPIIEDDYVVLPDPNSDDAKAKFATGFLKVTPAHDPNDYEIGQRHGLPIINVLSPTATISNEHGWPKEDFEQGNDDLRNLLGMDRYEAREAVVEYFRKNNLLEDVKPYRHSVGHSYRSHVAIEPYLSDQWYCKVTNPRMAQAALRAMAPDQREGGGTGFQPVIQNHGQDAHATSNWQGQLRFYPARYAKTFQTWHENIRDWCISRQLWWGHRIPVWRRETSFDGFPETTLGQVIAQAEAGTVSHFGGTRTSELTADNHAVRYEVNHARKIITTYVCLRDAHSKAQKELESIRSGYIQDPDVLDTWFSSGLWPLSTLNWPDQSEIQNPKSAINTWNPTSVLCTAREIITLWVSRMVMFNLYFLGRLPFKEVFIHAMIQDGEGRKMSKSLGNGVDPLDIIHSHGADAMRFTLASMATNTQDVRMPVERDEKTGRNTSPKFDVGRNFCNKLWNAARFAMMNLEGEARRHEGTKARSEELSLADRWIISRFHRTVTEAEEGLKEYRFDQYARACYDFFWRDFCDWYLEAIKPAMKDPGRAPQTAQVLAAVLDASLRLLHPMIPFITEIIWWKLNEVRPERGLPGLLETGQSPLLIRAPWPKAGATREDVEQSFATLQEIIVAIRNVRNEYKVDVKKPVTVSIQASTDLATQIDSNREMIELLATCKVGRVASELATPANAARAIASGCEIYVEGLIDPEAEKQRIAKRSEELKKQIAAMRGRLSNHSYVAKAPAHLVQQTRDQLAAAEAELEKLTGA